jgi:argininosuccinate lyase
MSLKLWGGRFAESTDALVEAFTESVSFDQRLYKQDIRGSQAHAQMLAKVGVLTDDEASRIVQGLEAILNRIEAGEFQWQVALEDVHMNIEAALTADIGEAGKKLHTGRSRNDQVATDIRLYVRDAIDALLPQFQQLAESLRLLAAREAHTLMPGFTHLQIAQPVTMGHHLLAWREMLLRDLSRFEDCRKRLNVCPLGAAALAGTVYPIDRHFSAELLGFAAPMPNSLDAVSDRDFALEFCAAASIFMVHLSRWSEEIILWMNPLFGFVKLPDRFCTGSSIMPQKKNPDVAELTRGKAGRVVGSLNALLMLMKAQPLAYNRDNQEDKEPLFDAIDTVSITLGVWNAMLPHITFNPEKCRKAATLGFCTATDLADYLVSKGMAFRDAHEVTGKAVALASTQQVDLADLPLVELQALSALIEADVFEKLKLENSLAARNHFGATAPAQVLARAG